MRGRRRSASSRPSAGGLPAQTGPVTISSGGTYTLNVLATDSTTKAVTISTTSPVTIQNSLIQHAGKGVWCVSTGAQITITGSTFNATTPSVAGSLQQHVQVVEPAALIVEHNDFNYGHGVQVPNEDPDYSVGTLRISYNDFVDMGKMSQAFGDVQGAIHTSQLLAPGGKILWNRVTNHYGTSWGEDEFGLATTRGASGNPIEVGHNLINGIYPFSGDGSGFTGGAIDLCDISGGYIDCHHCYVIGYVNNGLMQPTNAPGVTIDNCVAVYDGVADDGITTVSSTFGWGITVANLYDATGTQSVVTNCRVGHRRWNGGGWENAHYQWENQGTQDGGGNTVLTASSANETAMVAEFEASVISNGVTIGV